jgi:methylglutaconyl-CoA hydratase
MSKPTVRLGDLAHARSGDKGNTANIGVVARDDSCFERLRLELTEAAVAAYFSPMRIGEVRRFELPRLRAFNFVIRRALSGGASRSLRLDTQGKALGTAILELRLPVPDEPSRGALTERSSMAEPTVQRTDDGPVAVLTFNRPEVRNAISRTLMAELEHHLDRAVVDPKIRAIVLTGAGTVFCSGMDLKEAARERGGEESEHHAVVTLQQFADLIQKLHTLPKPVIAALNGDALAGGAGLMAACDFAIAAEQARIGYPEVLRGLVPSIVMFDLTRLVGDRRARQLLICGELIIAAEAFRWGLLNQVTSAESCLAEAIRVGKRVTESAPGAVAAIKRQLDETHGRPKSLRGAAAVSAAIRVSEEAQEGIRAFLEKRPPSWTQLH